MIIIEQKNIFLLDNIYNEKENSIYNIEITENIKKELGQKLKKDFNTVKYIYFRYV